MQNLSDAQQQIINRIISSFNADIQCEVNKQSDLCKNPAFSDYFKNLFSVYHSITEHKFEKKSFEFAFKYASIASGRKCEINNNPSNPGEDVTLTDTNERISLKTEGEKSENTFKISKFSEARFIAKYKTENEEEEISSLENTDPNKANKKLGEMDLRKQQLLPVLVEEFKKKMKSHLISYDRIIGLKCQSTTDENGEITSYRYRLIEIPKDLIEKATNLSAENFKALRGNGGTSATVFFDNGDKAFGVTLDGSVEKISITGIKISACITHAEFIIPVSV